MGDPISGIMHALPRGVAKSQYPFNRQKVPHPPLQDTKAWTTRMILANHMEGEVSNYLSIA